MIDEPRLYRLLGDRLRELRENQRGGRSGRKLTQAQLADAVGMERTSVTNIERGIQKVPLHVLYRMCEVLGTQINDVLPAQAELETAPAVAEESVDGFDARVTPLVKQKLTQLLNSREL